MAQAARKKVAQQQLPVDPSAVGRAYRLERAKRRARVERERERKRAAIRFFATIVLLLAFSVVLVVVVWRQVESLFGL